MATVGGVTVDVMRGRPTGNKSRSVVYRVSGTDGYGYQIFGAGDSAFAIELIRFGSRATVDAFVLAIEALVGTSVTIVDAFGQSFTGCEVVTVSTPRRKNVLPQGVRCLLTINGIRT